MDQSHYIELRQSVKLQSVSLGYRTVDLLKPKELKSAQQGYSVGPKGESLVGDAPGDWQARWLVVAEEDLAGDPLFVDLTAEGMPVYTASHGEGSWRPELVAESFEKFVAALELVKALSRGRTTPVDLEENPLSEDEVQSALRIIAQANPTADLTFWESWLAAPEL